MFGKKNKIRENYSLSINKYDERGKKLGSKFCKGDVRLYHIDAHVCITLNDVDNAYCRYPYGRPDTREGSLFIALTRNSSNYASSQPTLTIKFDEIVGGYFTAVVFEAMFNRFKDS